MAEENRSIDAISHAVPSWKDDLRLIKLESLQNNLIDSPMKRQLNRLYLRALVGTIFTRLLFSYYELKEMSQHYEKSNVWALITSEARQEDSDHYMLCINSFDSFVTKLYSSIQTMARLVFLVYNLNPKLKKIYFQNVKDQLKSYPKILS